MKNMQTRKQHGQHQESFDNPASTVPVPTVLSDDAIASLRFMIEEEKMAGDLYDAFYAQTGLTVFSRIAASEDKHMDALLKQADLAGLDVSDLLALPAGDYLDPAVQLLFDQLYASGSVSADAALAVGVAVEQTDIADLNSTLDAVAGTALVGVYSHLMNGSEHHLAAFETLLA